tara:strand:- start:2192 stop:2950 length:759 start_codon:yes stop_codon:yes gene_type:complete
VPDVNWHCENIKAAQDAEKVAERDVRWIMANESHRGETEATRNHQLERFAALRAARELNTQARIALVGEHGLYPIDPRFAMKTDDYERIMQEDRLLVMPVKTNAVHGHLDDFHVKGVVVAIGYMPDRWADVDAPHYIPHACAMMHQATGIVEKTNVAAFAMLHNLCNMLTMGGRDVYYPQADHPAGKPLQVLTRIYSPLTPPDKFRIMTTAFGIKDHIGQKIMGEAAPGFAEHLKEKDQQKYNELRSRIRGI